MWYTVPSGCGVDCTNIHETAAVAEATQQDAEIINSPFLY